MRYIFVFLSVFACTSNEFQENPQLTYSLEPAFKLILEDHPTRTWGLQAKVIKGTEYLFWGYQKL